MPAPPAGDAYDSSQRDCNLPTPSQKEIHEDYEHDDDDGNKRDKKVEGGDILVVEAG